MDTEQMTDNTSMQSLTSEDAKIESLEAEFSPEEQQVLESLATRYQQGLDLFSAREMERLRFMRWLYQQGYFPRPRAPRDGPRRTSRPRKASDQSDTQG